MERLPVRSGSGAAVSPPHASVTKSRLHILNFLILFGISVLLSPPGKAEIYSPGSVPPQPVPVKVEVERGKSVDIPLNVYGSALEDVTYRIRSGPRHGSLTEPQIVEGSRAVVTYSHNGEFGHDGDSFYYAAKSNAGVSAAVAVQIEIFDRPSKLIAPPRAEFGEVLIGTGAAVEITILNEGGGIATGTVSTNHPWNVQGSSDYSLGPEESATFTVTCAPEKTGKVYGTLRFSSDPTRETTLVAVAIPPFHAKPDKLELVLDRDSLVRSGQLEISNVLEFDQTIEIAAGEGILAPETVPLPAGGSKTVNIRTEPTNLAEINSEITLTGAGYTETRTVKAPPVPPILEIGAESLSFGSVRVGTAKSLELPIRNRGGERTYVYLDVSPPFAVEESSVEFGLKPGEERMILISAQPSTSGNFRIPIQISAFEQEMEVFVSVEALARREPAAVPLAAEGFRRQKKTPKYQKLPLIKPVRLAAISNRTATLAFPNVKDAATYRLEAQVMERAEDGTMQTRWIPFTEVQVQDVDGEIQATLSKLTPGGGYVVRAVAVDQEGKPIKASDSYRLVPIAKKGFRVTPLKVMVLFLVIILAIMGYLRYRDR